MRLFISGWSLSSRERGDEKADPEVASASIEGAAPAPAAVVESEQEYSCESIFRRKSEVNTRSNSSNSEKLASEASRHSSSCELSQLATSSRCICSSTCVSTSPVPEARVSTWSCHSSAGCCRVKSESERCIKCKRGYIFL